MGRRALADQPGPAASPESMDLRDLWKPPGPRRFGG